MMAEEREREPKYIRYLSRLLPVVVRPTFRQGLSQRLRWTLIVAILYLTLYHIPVYGLKTFGAGGLSIYEIVLGSSIGSLVTLGIGPIVSAGILLQLLVGSKIINWDTTKPEDREKFMFWNKFLAILFCLVEAFGFAVGFLSGNIVEGLFWLVVIQLALGGVIVILLDEIVSKWGFGSGVSLFIILGIGTQMFSSFFSPCSVAGGICHATFLPANNPGPYVGQVLNFFTHVFSGNNTLALMALVPIISTVAIFLIVAYTDLMTINVPITFGMLRGFGRLWSIKLLYTSVIPIILASALIANFQMMARAGASPWKPGIYCSPLACFDEQGRLIYVEGKSNVLYYLTPPATGIPTQLLKGTFTWREGVRALTYTVFLVALATVFSVFWVITSGMSAEAVAEQLTGFGFHIPGFRADARAMKEYLDRYISPLGVLGGIFIGLLAAGANVLGAVVGGTGILLFAMIIHNFYEQLRREELEEAPPLVRKLVEW